MSRSLSRTHVDRVTITKLFRRRLSADKRRGTPTWIGLSSQLFRGHFVRDVGKYSKDVDKIMDSLQKIGSSIPGLSVVSSSAAATRRGFVPRQTPVKRKFSEEKIDNTDKNVCNQCHQAYWPRSKQGQETPNDATKVFNDKFIYCFQFCIFLVQIFQNELLEHGVVVFLWWAWSWGQPRTFELPGQSREGPRDEPKQEDELDEEDVPDPAEEPQDDPHDEDPVDATEEALEVKKKLLNIRLFKKYIKKGNIYLNSKDVKSYMRYNVLQ